MTLTEEQVRNHLGAIREGAPGWSHAQKALLVAQNDIVPLLLEALKEHSPYTRQFQRLAQPLVLLGDARSLLFLIRLVQKNETLENHALLSGMYTAIEQRAAPQNIPILIDLLARSAPQWGGINVLVEFTPQHRLRLAEVIVLLAERDPRSEFRAALPLLRYHLLDPIEFLMLHKRLKKALADTELPIPSADAGTTHSLPLPAKEKRQ